LACERGIERKREREREIDKYDSLAGAGALRFA